MSTPLKKLNLTLLGAIVFAIAISIACSSKNNSLSTMSDSLRKDSSKVDSYKETLGDCMNDNEDTVLAKTDMAVKYILRGNSYDIKIRIHGIEKVLGYSYDCNVPLVIVPRFDWANDHILALIKGCGSYCSVNYYYQLKNDSIQELKRDDVFWYDKNTNLIAYENYSNYHKSITIENIYTSKKEIYALPEGEYGHLSEGKFAIRGNIFSMKIQVYKDDKVFDINKKIVLSRKLIDVESLKSDRSFAFTPTIKQRGFDCGIDGYWSRHKLVSPKIELIKEGHSTPEDYSQVTIIDSENKWTIANKELYHFLDYTQGEYNIYKVYTTKTNYYIVLDSGVANATQANTLLNNYLVYDPKNGNTFYFLSVGEIGKTFFVRNSQLNMLRFEFSKLFYEEEIFSLDCSTYQLSTKNRKFSKPMFLNCICRE